MAKSKRVVTENTEEISATPEIEQVAEDVVAPDIIQEELPKEIIFEKPVYVPDIPAQMIDEPKIETEAEFLLRILQIQEDGGFGRHLNKVIHERIKFIS